MEQITEAWQDPLDRARQRLGMHMELRAVETAVPIANLLRLSDLIRKNGKELELFPAKT
jgi:hypothetical protein